MRIALLGYGRMGREVEARALEEGHEVIARVDRDNRGDLVKYASECDVAVEFSGPVSAPDFILEAFSVGLPVVSGSTGWLARYDEVREACLEMGLSFIHSSNFSIGVNILFVLNRHLAQIMDNLPAYNCSIEEVHHIRKLDSPSGTAISLAEGICNFHRTYSGWKEGSSESAPGKIPVISVREGMVTGKHTVTWSSDSDSIILSHDARDRKGFASGALIAAAYLLKHNGVFTMNDILKL